MPHTNLRNSSTLIEQLYMTVLDDGALKPFLSELARNYDAALATVAVMNGRSRHDNLRISSTVEQESASAVPGHYAALSPFRPVMLQQQNYGRIMASREMIDEEQRACDAFINEFLKPDAHEFLLTGVFGEADGQHNYVVLNRGGNHGEFDDEAVMGLQELVPHFRTMLRIRNRMLTQDRHMDVIRTAADLRGDGMVLLDRRGVVRSMSARAEAFLSEADGLSLRDCRLHAALAEDDRQLQAALHRLLEGIEPGRLDAAISLAVRRPSGAQAWRLHIIPLGLRKFRFAGDEIELAIQLVGPPEMEVDESDLADRFGLSRSELRVMQHLVAGVPAKKIADILGNSVNTIKVHRRNLYRKLGVSRHYDLVRLVGGGKA